MSVVRAITRLVLFIFFSLLYVGTLSMLRLFRLHKRVFRSKTYGKTYLANYVTMWFFRLCCLICRISVRLEKGRAIYFNQDRSTLFLTNHISYLDIVVLGSVFPVNFVAKGEVSSWPIFGLAARLFNCVFIDRDNMISRFRGLKDLMRQLPHTGFCVFPEGTTSATITPETNRWYPGQLKAVKYGKSQVLCAGLAYKDQKHIAWVDDEAFVPHLWSFFRRSSTTCYINLEELVIDTNALAHVRTLSGRAKLQVVKQCILAHQRSLTPSSQRLRSGLTELLRQPSNY